MKNRISARTSGENVNITRFIFSNFKCMKIEAINTIFASVTHDGGKIATRQLRAPEAWLAAIEKSGTATDELTPIAREEAVGEMLMMGLRLVEGVARHRLETLAEQTVEQLLPDALPRLVDGGFLTLDGDRLAATAAGRQRLNAVLGALLA